MSTTAFLSLLIETLAKTIPASADQSETEREASLTSARTLFEAFEPANAMEAALAARAVAAHLAAMDSFARAAKPGVSDEKAIRLRNNALAASRACDSLYRTLRSPAQSAQPARPKPLPRATHPTMPAERVFHRAEQPLPFPGLPDSMTQTARRTAWNGTTALSPVQPTVLAPA